MTMRSKTNGALLFLSLAVSFVLPRAAGADMMSPDYYLEKCAAGETEVRCDYQREEIGGSVADGQCVQSGNDPDCILLEGSSGPITYDECAQYEHDPDYRLLAGTGGSLGGSERFCLKAATEKTVSDVEKQGAESAEGEKTDVEKEREFDEKIADRPEEEAAVSSLEGAAAEEQAEPGTESRMAKEDGEDIGLIGIGIIALAAISLAMLYALKKKRTVV